MRLIKFIWRSITTLSFRDRVARLRHLLNTDVKIITDPTFADDGLISQHISDFMNDERFLNAYREGASHGGLENHPGGIQFRVYVCCWAAAYASKLEGDFVECGVGKGFLSKAICTYLDFNKFDKKFFLFDTFSGIPVEDATSSSELENMETLNKLHYDTDYFDIVSQSFSAYSKVEIVKGKVPDTFNDTDLGCVAYISIDMNNAKAEIDAIKFLWGKLVTGGVIVLDDYAYGELFRAQKDAWDRFATDNDFEILSLPTGQGLIIKH